MTGLLVLGLFSLDIIAWRTKFNNVLAFCIAYILTRLLGAPIGVFPNKTLVLFLFVKSLLNYPHFVVLYNNLFRYYAE